MTSELESSVNYLLRLSRDKRKAIFWIVCIALSIWLVLAVREVSTLLLTAYAISILLDPLLNWLKRFGVNRSLGVILFLGASLLFLVALGLIALPSLVREYQDLIHVLPDYLRTIMERLKGLAGKWLGITFTSDPEQMVMRVKEYVSAIGVERLRSAGASIGDTVLKGYSLTLTLLNLLLLPFFVYYISVELHKLHSLVVA